MNRRDNRRHIRNNHHREHTEKVDLSDAFDNTDELRSQDFKKIDMNTFIMDSVKKMKCKEFALAQDDIREPLQKVMTFLDT